jgi:hypothetical protein
LIFPFGIELGNRGKKGCGSILGALLEYDPN